MSRSRRFLMARRGLFPAAVLLLLLAPACGVLAFAEAVAPAVTGVGAQHSPDGQEHAVVISCKSVSVARSSSPRRSWGARTLLALGVAAALGMPWPEQARGQIPARAGELSLQDLERMALEQNPTLPQARASLRAAEGREVQAGLYPNPLVGYELEDLNTREPGRHGNSFWLQVPVVTADKLQKSRDAAAADRQHARLNAEAQRLRVLGTVRMLYWEALGADRLVALREELVRVTREAVEISEQLFNVGQADRPDVLEVEIQSQRAELDLARARTHQQRLWRILAASVGNPGLPLTGLSGDLEAPPPQLDAEAVMTKVLRDSPEMRLAHVNLDRSRAGLARVLTRLGYNSDSYAPGRDVGFEAGVEIGLPLPIFDRQQGNLTAAEADVEHAGAEVRRLELALRSELATALRGHEDAGGEAERYRREILPRAERSLELFTKGFRSMAAAYPQVLIARRALTQARVEYTQALVEQWRSAALLEGMLMTGALDAPAHTSVSLPPATGHLPSGAGRTGD